MVSGSSGCTAVETCSQTITSSFTKTCRVSVPAISGSLSSSLYNPISTLSVPAAWMIERCGLKGRTLGGAAVYDKQPLVIVNLSGNASPEEIVSLENQVIAAVKEKFGVELHPEVEHL